MISIFHVPRTIFLAVFAERTALVAENLVLRQQVIVLRRGVARPRIRPLDRWLIATLVSRFRALVKIVVLVRPETVIAWHRAGWRLLWHWRSRSRRPPGRPPIDADRRALIRRLTRGRGQRWTTFIRNYLQETWACDFLVVVTARFRILYVFVVLALDRRRIVHLGVTEHPTSAWTAQRRVEAVADAEIAPRFLVHDRDAIYGAVFRRRVRGLGARTLLTPPRTPQANAFAERVIGTLRRDCLDHVIVRNERHAERVLDEYLGYYHGRPHRGLRMQPPDGALHLPPPRPPPDTRIVATPILGGLHHQYGFQSQARTRPTETHAAA